jgi:hypothetical protein
LKKLAAALNKDRLRRAERLSVKTTNTSSLILG